MLKESKLSQANHSKKLSQLTQNATKSILPNEEHIENFVVFPPDGGWGWVIVATSFVCNFLLDGTLYTFGIFLDEISETFKVHPTKVAIASSLMSGFYYIAGPFTCALTNRFGFRIIGMVGGVLASLAFFASTFSDNFFTFLILIGCVSGLGFNMIFTPSFLAVGFYFEKWRALAVAISLCGSSIGMVAFPPIMTKILDTSWKWKFRILGGGFALTIICSLTYRPIKPVKLTEDKKVTFLVNSDENDSIGSFHLENEAEQFTIKQIFKRFHNTLYPTVSELHGVTSTNTNTSFNPTKRMVREQSTLLATLPPSSSDTSISRSTFTNKTDAQSTVLYTVYEDENEREVWNKFCNKKCLKQHFTCCLCNNTYTTATITETVNRPMYRDDIFFTGSLYLLPEYSRSKVTFVSGTSGKKSAVSYHLSVTRVSTQGDLRQVNGRICCPDAIIRTLVTMLDFRLLKSASFVIFTISGFITMIGLYCPFIFIVQRAENMKIDKEWCKLLLTIVGVSNTIGRILCGIISSFPKTDSLVLTYITTFITGGITIISNYCYTLEGQIIFAVIFGINIASFATLRSIVLVDILGLENLTNAFGITLLFYGIGSFLGLPISGAIQNFTGNYEASFIFAGCAFLLSAILLLPVKKISKWETKKKKQKVIFKY